MSREEWLARQFPTGTLSIGEIVSRTVWMHSAGGTGPYLSLKARKPSLTRQQIDDAVYRRFEVVELPVLGDHKYYALDHGRTRELRLAFIDKLHR